MSFVENTISEFYTIYSDGFIIPGFFRNIITNILIADISAVFF